MSAAVGSGERRSWGAARPRTRRWAKILVATVLLAIALVMPPFGISPAAAAPPVVRVTLTQSSADSAIGTDLTLTATVALSGGSAESPAGWYVVFTGTADGGWSSGPVPTAAGVARYHRTSPVPQTETITARLATPDCSAESSTLTHEWWEPEITLNEQNAVTPTDADFELTGFVTRGEVPVGDASVRVDVINFAPADPNNPQGSEVIQSMTVLETTTADAGEFAVTLPGRPASIDKITATATATGGFSARTVTAHSWSDADSPTESLTLTAASEARVADPLVATAEFQPASAATGIMFLTDEGWAAPNTESPDGRARYAYAGQSAADWAGLGVRTSPTGLHRASIAYWWQPVITFVAPDSHSASGESYPATVIVTDRGRPVPGMYLAFTAPGIQTQYATTNDAGIASAPITGQVGEPLTIDVAETAGESAPPLPPLHTPATGSTTHTWVSPPPRVDVDVSLTRLDSKDDESRVGTRVPFVARVTSGANPLQGWDVAFDIDGEDLGTAVSDALGETVITASRSTESDSVIEATVVITGCTGRWTGSVGHYWWETSLDLNPKAITSPARHDVPFTADLARTVPGEDFAGETAGSAGDARGPGDVGAAAIPPGMIGLAGQPIRFTMSSQSCDLPVVVREATTDELGSATVTLSRDGPSIDTVRAEEVGVFDPAAATTTHTWGTPDPVPLSITLDQSGEESRAGTAVTVTATVRDVGRPDGLARAGTPVTFLGVTPSRTVVTDDRGTARLTFTGTGTAPTEVTASAPFGCGVVLSEPITHRWFVPTLELRPTIATSTTGETATVTARLRNGSAPVPGQQIRLTVDGSASNQPMLAQTRTTDGDGRVTINWTRTEPGTDVLMAVELVDVLPRQASATHIWEAPPVTPSPVTPTPATPTPVTPTPATPTPVTATPTVITETPATEEPSEEPSESEEPTSPPPPTAPPTTSPRPTTEPPSDLPATSTMVDGPEVGRPGADIEMSGTGCRAGESLSVSLGETELGTTRAAADGTFYLRAVVPDLPLGRYVIHSTCGHTIGDPNVDITSPQVDKAGAAIAAVAVTTASTFVFFLLIAKGIISFLPRRPM